VAVNFKDKVMWFDRDAIKPGDRDLDSTRWVSTTNPFPKTKH